MERIIIKWSGGDEECYCDHIVPVLYESVEAFYVHFHEAIEKWIFDSDKFIADNVKWWEEFRKVCPVSSSHTRSAQEKQEQKRRDYQQEYPRPISPYFEIIIGGVRFNCGHFVSQKSVGKKLENVINMPDILIVDEWFNRNCHE